MTDKTNMDARDTWLLELYEGEASTPPSDPTLADEAVRIREMKNLLEARPPRRPDPTTVQAIFAAAQGDATHRARADRPPLRRRRALGLRVGAVSAALAAVIALVGIWQAGVFEADSIAVAPSGADAETMAVEGGPTGSRADGEPAGSDASTPTTREPASVASNPLANDLLADDRLANRLLSGDALGADRADELVRRPGGSVQAPRTGLERPALADAVIAPMEPPASGQDSRSSVALEWDEQDDVIQLHQRIELVGTGVDQRWDAPAVPLEMMPSGRGGGYILPAGQQR